MHSETNKEGKRDGEPSDVSGRSCNKEMGSKDTAFRSIFPKTKKEKIAKINKMALETQEFVSRKEVEGMRIGETRTFALPNFDKIKSARANIREYGLSKGIHFATDADLKNFVLTVTRDK